MTPKAGREALNHFLAAALIGLALTGLSDALPALSAREQGLTSTSLGYAALSLLIAAGMGLYSYLRSHQAQLTDEVAHLLEQAPPDPGAKK